MPKNPQGEVNTNVWLPTRAWSISLSANTTSVEQTASIISRWATERRKLGKCFLAGQVHEAFVARPGGTQRAMQINGEINPEHASYCSNDSARRLLYRLTFNLLINIGSDRAWIRYNGESMAVTYDWLKTYFEENSPSTTSTSESPGAKA